MHRPSPSMNPAVMEPRRPTADGGGCRLAPSVTARRGDWSRRSHGEVTADGAKPTCFPPSRRGLRPSCPPPPPLSALAGAEEARWAASTDCTERAWVTGGTC